MASLERVDQALAWARTALAGASDSEPIDAPLLLMSVLGIDRAALLAHPERTLTAEQADSFRQLIERRAAGEPVPYLIGTRAFFDRDWLVTPAVLIPRPETEHLIEAALEWAHDERENGHEVRCVVDVGTGSGAIAVTLAAHLPDARVWAVDLSPDALAVARENAARANVRVQFLQGDLLAPLLAAGETVDLVVANLPYIPSGDLEALPVARWEPRLALDGGADGLDLIRRLLAQLPTVLAGLALLEIGAGQGARVSALAETALPGARVRVLPDYAGHDRVVWIERLR